MSWRKPLAAFLAAVDDSRDEVEDVLADVRGSQHAGHLLLGGMPPPEVQLAQLAHSCAVRVAAKCSE